ncbi:MAG: hypothetical protein ACR2FX_07215 [Chthoniobacterales bacterium]
MTSDTLPPVLVVSITYVPGLAELLMENDIFAIKMGDSAGE